MTMITPSYLGETIEYSSLHACRSTLEDPTVFTMEGDFTSGQARALWPNLNPQTAALEPIADDLSDAQTSHLLGRWTRANARGASLQIQSFVELSGRQEPVGNYNQHTFDVDTQYHTALGAHQDLVAGAGYRFVDDRFAGHVGFSLTPVAEDASLLTAFLQDEIGLFGKRLAVTLGSQVQHDSTTGAGVQPTARVMWKALPHQRLWAATSRALRTPSEYERGIRIDFPPVPSASGLPLFVTVLGNPAAQTERLVDAEVGYRLEIGTAGSIDVTGFVGSYHHLRTEEPAAPVVQFVPSPQIHVTSQFGNQLQATTRGLEAAANWKPVSAWRLDGSYTAFHVVPLAAASQDPSAATADGSAPRAEWQARSAFSPGTRATFNVAIFRVGRLEQYGVAAYTRADVSAEWRFTSGLSAMAIGQNLFTAAHPEFAGAGSFLLVTEVPRSASVRLRWTFQ